MNEYVKSLLIKPELDESSKKRISNYFTELEQLNIGFDASTQDSLRKQLEDRTLYQENLRLAEKELEMIADLNTEEAKVLAQELEKRIEGLREKLGLGGDMNLPKEREETLKGLNDLKAHFIQEVGDTLTGAIKSFEEKTKQLFKDAWDELGNILDYSQLSSQTTRETAFTYGFSASESYAFNLAKRMLGFESDEDLMYANAQELSQFRRLFEKYSEKYSQLYDAGFFEKYQDFTVEMQELKEDLLLEVVEFYTDNKDTLIEALHVLIEAGKLGIQVFSGLLSLFSSVKEISDSERAALRAQAYSKYTDVSNNTTIKMDNTFNNVNDKTSSSVNNALGDVARQIIMAIQNGGI